MRHTDKIEYICEECGKPYLLTYYNLVRKDRKDRKKLCLSCKSEYANSFKPKGEKKPPHSGKHGSWAKKVKIRDMFCRFCGDAEKLVAHHIWPYARFPEYRYELWNGLTLCEDCHKELHSYKKQIYNNYWLGEYH